MIPTLELTFHDLSGSPWEGWATARHGNQTGKALPVCEGISPEEREEVRWYIEEFMDLPEGGNLRRARDVENNLEGLGHRLWDGLSGLVPERWLAEVQNAREGRLELRAATLADEMAFRAPWELLRVEDEMEGGGLIHQLGVTIVRRLDPHRPRLAIPDTSQGLRLLAIVCRPEDAGFLDPRYTPEAILQALAGCPEATIDFCRPPTLDALVHTLESAQRDGRPYHIVHFDGHGTTLPNEGGTGVLCFEKADGSLDLVRAPRLGDLLSRLHVPLVVLEACRTATKAFAQDTVASALLRHGVGTVLAMGHAVHVDLTRELMASFYESIAGGVPLGEALRQARSQAYTRPERRIRMTPDPPTVRLHDWFVPQLYQGEQDPCLLPRRPSPREPVPEPPFVGFPPAPRAGFQGRGQELHRLERAVSRHRAVVVHAPGGTGKTSLVREAALWWIRTGYFPDGAVFVSLEGNPSPDRLIAEVGEALAGIEFHRKTDGAAWLEREFERRRMLLVWDNYESVLPAFNAGRPTSPKFGVLCQKWTVGGSRVLVTSRSPDVGLEAGYFQLGELNCVEGLMLVAGYLDRMGFGRLMREERGWAGEQLEPLVVRTGGHPLALELLAPHVAELGPAQVAEQLSELLIRAEQESWEGRTRSLAASFAFSVRHLSAECRAILPAMALLAGGCMERIARSVVGLDKGRWHKVIGELEDTGLVRVDSPFIRPHPMLADLEEKGFGASGNGDPGRRGNPQQDIEKRFVEKVSEFAWSFNELARTPDARHAVAAMAITEAVARRALERAVSRGLIESAGEIAVALRRFLRLSGRRGEADELMTELADSSKDGELEITEATAILAREVAVRRAATDPWGAVAELTDLLSRLRWVSEWDTRAEQAWILVNLGHTHNRSTRKPAEAVPVLEEAVRLCTELESTTGSDTSLRSAALYALSDSFFQIGRAPEALATAQETLQLDRERQDPGTAARAEHRIGQILKSQERHTEAQEWYVRALRDAELARDREASAGILYSLGVVLVGQGRFDEAIDLLKRALRVFQSAGDERGRRQVFNVLGNVELGRSNLRAALAWYERSLGLAQDMADLEGQATSRSNRAITLARLAGELEDPDERLGLMEAAIADHREALTGQEELGDWTSVAREHTNLAFTLSRLGALDEGKRHALESVALHERLDLPEVWRPLVILEHIAQFQGDIAKAEEFRRRKEAALADAEREAGAT